MSHEISNQHGEIDLTDEFLSRYAHLYMNDDHSDIKFSIDETKISAHKFVLSTSSSYFCGLFSNGFIESSLNEIELQVPLDAFKLILKYIYTGRLSLIGLDVNEIIEIYKLANMYGFDSLNKAISKYLKSFISLDNCHSIMNTAKLYSLEDLKNECLNFIDINAIEFLSHDTFTDLSQDVLCDLLKRDTFYATEIDIFKAIKIWYERNPTADIKVILAEIRWLLMSAQEVIEIVLPSKILDQIQLCTLLEESKKARCVPCVKSTFSPFILRDVNIATAEFNAKKISGEGGSGLLLDGKLVDKNGAYHSIYHSNGITLQLGKVSPINHIKFLFANKCGSYHVETSVDGVTYGRLVNYDDYRCRSWQFLYFPTRYVKNIRLKGNMSKTYSFEYVRKLDVMFEVNGIEAMQKDKLPDIVNGFVKPTYNVASVEMGAKVIQGVGGDNMLNNSDESTCHDSSIVVQLGQPYHIGSLRLFPGCKSFPSNGNSFYIETSLDKTTWAMAVDKRNEELSSSWHQFEFAARPVSYIRITGTKGRSNMFTCTGFECPSSVGSL